MKAVFFDKPGGIEVLTYGEFPTPELNAGEALIRVKACGLNHLDIWLRQERLGEPVPHIAGSDVSGIIEKINGKSTFNVGDEIIVNPAIPCGKCERCQKGLKCEHVIIFGAKTQGGYAEFVRVPLSQLYSKPKSLSFESAAAFPLTFMTAWNMLVTRAQLQKDETVFVWGASGGLGNAGIQIAKHLGARVIAAARNEEIAMKLKQLGADETIIYPEGKVIEKVKSLTHEKGMDVVFESVGAKTWETTLLLLKPFGRVVIAGTTSGNVASQDLSEVYYHQLSILGVRMGSKEDFENVFELVKAGKLIPRIDSIYPLEKVAEAHEKMEKGNFFGKIVLKVE